MTKLILASKSPRRRALIQLTGYPYEVISADVDENSMMHPDSITSVMQTAHLKATSVAAQINRPADVPAIVIGADTTVVLGDHMLGKPADEGEAWSMLQALRGHTHHVHTGISLIDMATGRKVTEASTTVVTMRPYSDDEIAAYVASGDPMDKAGAYAIQHPIFRPVAALEGCYMGVVGLSICHLLQLLRRWGVPIKADMEAVDQAHHQYPCRIFAELRASG